MSKVYIATLLAGIVVGAAVGFTATIVSYARAASTTTETLQMVDSTYVGSGATLRKIYDNNNGAVCYVVTSTWSSEGPGISCFKN